MSRVVFSQAARQDRRAITEYTIEQFGIRQARRFRRRFEAHLDLLVDSPLIGSKKPELDPPGWSFRYSVFMKSFIVVYEPTDDGIRVARILHGARNLTAELERDAGESE